MRKLIITDYDFEELLNEIYDEIMEEWNEDDMGYEDFEEFSDDMWAEVSDRVYYNNVKEIDNAKDLEQYWRTNGWTLDRGYGGEGYKDRVADNTNWDLIFDILIEGDIDEQLGGVTITKTKLNDAVIFSDELEEDEDEWEDVSANIIVQGIDIEDILTAIKEREDYGGEDEQGSGGLWDLAFEETASYMGLDLYGDLEDKYNLYMETAEEVYGILVANINNYKQGRRPVLNENTLNENTRTDKIELIQALERYAGVEYHADDFKGAVDILYNYLIDSEMFTEEEVNLVTELNGYNERVLNDILFVRYGYRDLIQYLESEMNLNENTINENRKLTEVYRLELGAEYEEERVTVDVYNIIFYTDLDEAKAAGEAHLLKGPVEFLTNNYYIIYDVSDKLEQWQIDEIQQTGYTEAVADAGVSLQDRLIYQSKYKLQEGLDDFEMYVEYVGGL